LMRSSVVVGGAGAGVDAHPAAASHIVSIPNRTRLLIACLLIQWVTLQ